MEELQIELTGERPYFAELPYYLWGQVNYDSEGNSKRPTDREWTWIYLCNRESDETIEVSQEDDHWTLKGRDKTIARLALLLIERANGVIEKGLKDNVGDWDHLSAAGRAKRVADEFEQPILEPFDSHMFWGSWKWVGWYATSFTWVGRWIMHSIVCNDLRGIPLCIDWLKDEPFPPQEKALVYAVQHLSGETQRSAQEWIRWYDGGWFRRGAKRRFPELDFDQWLIDLKKQYGE